MLIIKNCKFAIKKWSFRFFIESFNLRAKPPFGSMLRIIIFLYNKNREMIHK